LPYLYLWTGVQAAAMPFAEFLLRAGPVAIIGVTIYLFTQRWLCDGRNERGLHWRGTMLKFACWPIFMLGTLLAIARTDIPYIPTAKEAHRGRFLNLAWPHLALMLLFLLTLARVIYVRMVSTPEEALNLTSEAVWGMIGYATLAVGLLAGGVYAAWQARHKEPGFAWDDVDIERLGNKS
jgi:cellulose synthase (UDP-forming)